jgi:hypothetical protein
MSKQKGCKVDVACRDKPDCKISGLVWVRAEGKSGPIVSGFERTADLSCHLQAIFFTLSRNRHRYTSEIEPVVFPWHVALSAGCPVVVALTMGLVHSLRRGR